MFFLNVGIGCSQIYKILLLSLLRSWNVHDHLSVFALFFFGDPYCFGDPGTFLVILVLVFISGSDSEGNEEPVVGNVNKFCVVPPGFTGRPRRGHLIFDACFESGTIHLIKDFQ